MKQTDDAKIGRKLCFVLRHNPESIGITLDEHGWADAEDLIKNFARVNNIEFNRDILERIVRTDNKQRYSFSEDKKLIRANQGHSIPVDVELEEKEPPEFLYHGTAERFTESIDRTGLQRMSRLYVHLSKDVETAKSVGIRHGKVIVYKVHTGEMFRNGFKFYLSANCIWLADFIPVEYLEKL